MMPDIQSKDSNFASEDQLQSDIEAPLVTERKPEEISTEKALPTRREKFSAFCKGMFLGCVVGGI